MEEKELPQRKHPRLSEHIYREEGAYFITICTDKRRCLLSTVGRGLAPAAVSLSEYGKAAEQELVSIPVRFPTMQIDKYVIMPNHIHFIMTITNAAGASPRPTEEWQNAAAGASPRPTVMDAVCAFKSLVTRRCRALGFRGRLFQGSFYDHIIRSREDYEEHLRYIESNPQNWSRDELFVAE